MNKKFLSAILFGAMMATSAGTFVSCKDYDDDIESLSDRISAVETLVKELQSQIQSGAVITNVTKGANGVVVTLSNGNTFEVFNGTNGTNGVDGKDGKDGSIVTIGENGNWYIDGVDTGKPSQGVKGDKGETGGIAPVYYYPGIEGAEDGYWVKVTTDAEGKETKEITSIKWASSTGTSAGVSAIWSNDVLTLTNVRGAENGTVKIALTGDLKALVFEVDMVLDGQNAMEYIWTPYNAITKGGKAEGKMKVHQIVSDSGSNDHSTVEKSEPYTVGITDVYAEEYTYLNPTQIKQYHMDPATSIVPSWWAANQALDVVSNDIDFIKTRALGNDAAAEPTANYKGAAEGIMNVGITMAGQLVATQEEVDRYQLGIFADVEAIDDKITDLAVQAPLDPAKENVITSTYASVYASQMAVEAIAYSTSTYAENYIVSKQEYGCEALVGNAANHATPLNNGRHLYYTSIDAAEQAPTVELAYNSLDGVNLHQLVTTHVGYNSCRSWNDQATYTLSIDELKAKGMKYGFEQVDFTVGVNGTEQSQNHSILEDKADGTHIVACGVKSLSDTDPSQVEADPTMKGKSYASIGRTPLVRVTLNDTINNKVVKVGYIKFKIVAPEQPIVSEAFDLGAYYYSCAAKTKKIAWHAIEAKLLDAARQTSKATFDALYEIDKNELGFVNQYVPAANSVYGQKQFALADVDYTADVNGDGFAYENVSNVVSKAGKIAELEDDGAEATDVFKWVVDRADFVWAYEQFEASYPEITITRYIKYNVKKNLGNSNFNVEPVFLPITITFRYPAGIMANKIAKYWYAENSMNEDDSVLAPEDMKYIHANVEVPATNVEEWGEADTRFFVDLDSRFELFEIGHADENQKANTAWTVCEAAESLLENAPSIEVKKEAWNLDWNTEANFPDFINENLVYYYFFNLKNNKEITVKYDTCPDDAHPTNSYEVSYTLSVDNVTPNDPTMLYGEDGYQYLNTVLYAEVTGSGVKTPIAKIEHSNWHGIVYTGGEHTAQVVVLNNDVAKALLNKPEAWTKDVTAEELLKQTLDVEIEVAAFNLCGEYLPLKDNTFGVELLKPVYAEARGPIVFADSHDNGEDLTKVNLADLVTFYDWRQMYFNNFNGVDTDDNLGYYFYYGVEDINVNMLDIHADINGVCKPLREMSLDVEFHLYRNGVRVDDNLGISAPAGPLADPFVTWSQIVNHFGELRYYNNTGTVVKFDIWVPVQIKHTWSDDAKIVWVKGTVNRSHNN